jgi:hypothetical protein
VVGSNNGSGSEITNCYATANVYGKSEVGGVVGYNTGTVENSYATGNVSGIENYVGGVAGGDNGAITNCKASGDVSGLNNVGGVAGYTSNTMENSYATGDVNGNNYVGGVVGYVYSTSTVENSYATGNVSGYNYVGGVSGRNIGMVINCYATGNVSGNDYVGGVVGGGTGTVKNCVALNPNINSMNTQYGRIIGIVTTGTITNNYARRDMKVNNGASIWTNDINGEDGADITPVNYQLQSWWSSSAGFDFSATGVWAWHNASGLPVLGVKK